MLKALPFIYQLDRVARRTSDVSAADWRYQSLVKKYHSFYVVTAFLGAGNPCITPQCI